MHQEKGPFTNMNSYWMHKMREIKKEQLQQIHENNMREKKYMRPGNVGNIAKQLQQKKRVQMSVLEPSQQPLAHHGGIKTEDVGHQVLRLSATQSDAGELRTDGHERDGGKKRKRTSKADQDHGKQMVEKEKEEEEEQTPNAMQNADVGHQVLPSSAMQSDAGELRTDGQERDDSQKGKKTRGRTMKAAIHALTEEGKKAIIMNANFQPIGPDEKTVSDFVEFLGTLSRTSSLCPLTVDKWTDMNKVYKDAKEKIWDYVKKRWDVPDGAKKWVLQTVGVLWRNFKSRLKRNHYTAYETIKMRLKNRPKDVADEDFKILLKKWNDRKYKELCKKNAGNRAKQTNLHTCGPKIFVVIRERLKKEQKGEPALADMYKKNRARVLGRMYKETGEDTQDKIVRMEELQSQQSRKSGEDAESSCFVDPFLAIMGKERNGRVRLHGRGVTPSSLGKESIGSGSSSINIPNEFLESIKADVTAQAAAELTANMMQTVTTQVAQHLCSSVSFHLKQINPIFDIDPAVLMRLVTTTSSPGDASSAPNQKSSVGLNGDSLIGVNRTHSKRGITGDDDEEDDDVIDRLK